jgi:hypothetical protein
MAKRTRYPNRTKARPASRPSRAEADAASANVMRRAIAPEPTADDDMPARSSSGLTDAEMRRAEELEAELAAKERAAIAESLRRRARTEERGHGLPADHNQPLSVRAAHEYAYVARDVRRIAATASLMVGLLALIYLLTHVLGVVTLP